MTVQIIDIVKSVVVTCYPTTRHCPASRQSHLWHSSLISSKISWRRNLNRAFPPICIWWIFRHLSAVFTHWPSACHQMSPAVSSFPVGDKLLHAPTLAGSVREWHQGCGWAVLEFSWNLSDACDPGVFFGLHVGFTLQATVTCINFTYIQGIWQVWE